MIYPIYCVHDQHVGFGAITVADNDAVAMRQFQNACDVDNSLFQTAPQDYTLYRIGSYDTKTGEITPQVPKVVCMAQDFVFRGEK